MSEKKSETFSWPVNVGHISKNPVTAHVEADERQRKALARRWNIPAVESVEGDFDLSRWKRDGVRVKGRVKASLIQNCVVTLEPVRETIEEEVEALFVPEGSRLARVDTHETGEMVVDAEGPDMPETFTGDSLDIAAICEEFIVLAMNPYPRKEGAAFTPPSDEVRNEPEKVSPFAGLKGWSGTKQ